MGFQARQTSAGNFAPVPEGTHIAVCTTVADIGLQPGGKYDDKYRLVIGWTLPNELTEKGEPMRISQTYTCSMNKKANLRRVIEGWFNKAFPTEEAAQSFDFAALLKRACQVNVMHKQSGEKTYANVQSVVPLAKGTPSPDVSGYDVLYYAPTDEAQTPEQIKAAYIALPDWIRKKIDEQLPPPAKVDVESDAQSETAGSDNDAEIPF